MMDSSSPASKAPERAADAARNGDRARPRRRRGGKGAFLVGVTVAVVVFAASTLDTKVVYPRIANIQQDCFAKYRPGLPTDDRIIHVDIDDGTIRALGRYLSWQRTYFADAIDSLVGLGARLILFDVLFTDPSAPVLKGRAGHAAVVSDTARHFDLLESAVTNLIDEINAAEDSDVDGETAARLLGQVREGIRDSKTAATTALSSAIHDPDRVLAESVRRAGNVLLPLHIIPHEELRIEEGDVNKIKAVLSRSFGAGIDEIARATGLSTTVLRRRLERIKHDFAVEKARQNLDQLTGNVDHDARVLFPDQPAPAAAERKIIRDAVNAEQAAALVLERDAIPAWSGAETRPGRLRPPIYALARGARHVGVVNSEVDAVDSVLRRTPLYQRAGERVLLHLSIFAAAACADVPIDKVQIVPGECVILKDACLDGKTRRDLRIPIEEFGRHLVNFAATRGRTWTDVFSHVPFGALVEVAQLRRDIAHNEALLSDNLTAIDQHFLQGGMGRAALQEELARAHETGDQSAQAALKEKLRQVDARILAHPLAEQAQSASDADLADAGAEEKRLMRLLRLLYANANEAVQATQALRTRRAGLTKDLRERIQDKVCIIGATFTGSTDDKATPVGVLPGVMVYSHFLNSFLKERFLRPIPKAAALALYVALCAVGLWVCTRWSPLISAPVTAGIIVAYLGGAFLVFDHLDIILEPRPILGMLAVFAGVTSYRMIFEQKRGRVIKGVFSHYLHPDVVAELTENPDGVKLGGDTKDVTLFFSDIAGFTPVSERLTSEEVVSLLNDYLGRLTEQILTHHGLLDKYEGDAIMAIFGAPQDLPNHAASACLAALDARQAGLEFSHEIERNGSPPIRTRIGLNSGRCVVGNIGSAQRLDYTAIGDAVNLASRLEGANKAFGTDIMISESTFSMAKDVIEARPLDLLRVKGKTEPTEVYELLSRKGQLDPETRRVMDMWRETLDLYRRREWSQALAAFEAILSIRDDGPSRAYCQRCRGYQTTPPPPEWDGVYVMTTK